MRVKCLAQEHNTIYVPGQGSNPRRSARSEVEPTNHEATARDRICERSFFRVSFEEQQEEVTVRQSIFQDDLQILQGENGQGNICFNLTVKVNIPFERIGLEAFVPVPGHEENVEERSTRLGCIGREPGTCHREVEN